MTTVRLAKREIFKKRFERTGFALSLRAVHSYKQVTDTETR
jgi:hypothetical protein